MPSPQKTKGKGYENTVAKYLTQVYGDQFMRVPTSGAYLGGINYDRRTLMTEGQVRAFKGDIIPPDEWNYFNCECKFYKSFNFHQLYDGNKLLDGWITETLTTANPKDLNLIFMKFNNIGEYMAYEVRDGFKVEKYTQYSNNWHITSKSQFWQPYNIQLIKHKSTGITTELHRK